MSHLARAEPPCYANGRQAVLDLSLVHAFVTVAELEHVGRAARVLRISQSPLSRKLQHLEAELGVRLFRREGRGLRLTSLGKEWLGDAKALLATAERAAERATALANGQATSLCIGLVQSALWSELVPAALRKLRRSHPDAKISVRGLPSAEQVRALERGELDVGIVHRPPRGSRFRVTLLGKEPFVLALARDHALARKQRILPRDLDGCDFVVLARAVSPEHRERLLTACSQAGFTPRIGVEAHDFGSVLGLVEAGMGAALIPAGARRAGTRVVLRELSWMPLALSIHLLHEPQPKALVGEFAKLLEA